jgi:hypothetical protein
MTVAAVARACERNPRDAHELRETTVALEILLADGLAERQGLSFRPTRAAVRAQELSF